MKRLDWYIARRYLAARNKGRFLSVITWIALGGVTVGVSALVVVIAVMTGMQKDLKAKILGTTSHIMVVEHGAALRMSNWRSVIEIVRADPDVEAARPVVMSQVAIKLPGVQYTQMAQLYGISTDTTGSPPTPMEDTILASLQDPSARVSELPPIMLGQRLADQMQMFRGDTLVVLGLEAYQVDPFGGGAPMRQFEITGTFTTGMYEYDTSNAYTTIEHAQELLRLQSGDVVSAIFVSIRDPEAADAVSLRLSQAVGVNYAVSNWEDLNSSLFSALKLEKIMMGLILFLIVLVAAFNIVSTLILVVADRTREIGILKSMGMTDGGILRVFVMQGAWIGIVGTVLGTILGAILCWILETTDLIKIPPDVYFVDRLPVSLELPDLLVIVLTSITIAFLATIYPALQAARLQPVEAIRHD